MPRKSASNHCDDLEHALPLARKAHDLEITNATFSDTLGWIQYRKGDYPAAVQILGEAVRRDPEDATMRYHLGMTQRRSGRDKEALSNLQFALKLNPQIPEAANILNEIAALQKSAR